MVVPLPTRTLPPMANARIRKLVDDIAARKAALRTELRQRRRDHAAALPRTGNARQNLGKTRSGFIEPIRVKRPLFPMRGFLPSAAMLSRCRA